MSTTVASRLLNVVLVCVIGSVGVIGGGCAAQGGTARADSISEPGELLAAPAVPLESAVGAHASAGPDESAVPLESGASSQSGATTERGPQPIPRTTSTVRSVSIPSAGIRTTGLERLGLLGDGTLAAPADPDQAGWFSAGTVPGDVGPAVIAGHVDSRTGPAVFATLRRAKAGATVVVGLSQSRTGPIEYVRFRVDRVLSTPKRGFPTDEVFGPTPDAQLRLITCSGPYDRDRGYLDNTIVFATRV